MRKAVLITLIVLVTAGIGIILYMEFGKETIVFCGGEKETVAEGYKFVGHNSYYSGISNEEIQVALNMIEDGDPTGAALLEALTAKAKPVFYPAFYLNLTQPDPQSTYFYIDGEVLGEFLQGQSDIGYKCQDLQLNLYSSGVSILSMANIEPVELVRQPYTLPVINEGRTEGQMKFDDTNSFHTYLALDSGKTSGTITFEFIYAINNSNILNLTSLGEQSLVVDVTISNNNGVISATFA